MCHAVLSTMAGAGARADFERARRGYRTARAGRLLTNDFDAGFRPAAHRVSSRWQSVARAHRDGRSLPPIAVIERPDGYYVLDGRHRVSVARALGHASIDAQASRSVPVARAPHRAVLTHADFPGR